MRTLYLQLSIWILIVSIVSVSAQDTFSIVAVDPATGDVGSAGASCVNLNNTGYTDDFLGELLPGVGAINTQAFYDQTNQMNARNLMIAGNSPSDIIDWLINNDVSNNPTTRQYGVIAFHNGSPAADAYTGINTNDYKGHRIGTDYAIQGNILRGPEVLDEMEANFNNASGSLACRLMAAMQGANIPGADSRCLTNGTSSLFAYLKVAQPGDSFGNPSILVSLNTANGAGIEPIDSLQTLFDKLSLDCSNNSIPDCTEVQISIPLMEQLGYHAILFLDSDAQISGNANHYFRAGNNIELKTNFEVFLGAEFEASIVPCN